MANADELFSVAGKRIVITGGGGVLGGRMARALAARGAKVCILEYLMPPAETLCREISGIGGFAICAPVNVMDKAALQQSAAFVQEKLGGLDILINAAGGNRKEATCAPDRGFFDLPADVLRGVVDLNLLGTILPSQVFGAVMARDKRGVIVNISSMTADRPLTNVVGYSAAKAAVSNFTRWLAVYLAQNVSPAIRVNALAPGFFLTEQNRFLLTDKETGALTPRGQAVITHTPAGRFGDPADLIGTLIWLCSDASSFVTGAVIPVDGGFSAYAGV